MFSYSFSLPRKNLFINFSQILYLIFVQKIKFFFFNPLYKLPLFQTHKLCYTVFQNKKMFIIIIFKLYWMTGGTYE